MIDYYFSSLDQGVSDRALSALKSITDEQNLPKRIKHIANGKAGKRYFERVLGIKRADLF